MVQKRGPVSPNALDLQPKSGLPQFRWHSHSPPTAVEDVSHSRNCAVRRQGHRYHLRRPFTPHSTRSLVAHITIGCLHRQRQIVAIGEREPKAKWRSRNGMFVRMRKDFLGSYRFTTIATSERSNLVHQCGSNTFPLSIPPSALFKFSNLGGKSIGVANCPRETHSEHHPRQISVFGDVCRQMPNLFHEISFQP